MIGFLPGFPFMGDLPAPLRLPRRAQPRVRVPAGSVAIATGLTAIYPWESPGGWHLLGRCPVPLFDARRTSPSLLAAGDRVRFVPVSAEECRAIEAGLASAEIDPCNGWKRPDPRGERSMSTRTEVEILSRRLRLHPRDGGRRDHRRIGVPWAGVLDRRLMRIANALASRAEDAAVIECFDGGLHVAASGGAVKLAVAGDAVVEVEGTGAGASSRRGAR